MALLAQLQFGDNAVHLYTKTYNIVDCRCHFCRTYNHSRPESDARCERIELTVVAPAMTDPLLYEWYINQGEQNCRLAFFFSAWKLNEKCYWKTPYVSASKRIIPSTTKAAGC